MSIYLSPIIKQYLNIKKRYKKILLFYQIGDFYELFYDDAIKISNLLNLKLTFKKFVKQKNVPMAGLPLKSSKRYILKLIKLGESVVICNQVNNSLKNKDLSLKKRKVFKIITPGTISESYYIGKKYDNLISCIYLYNNIYYYSVIDIFSGKFNLFKFKNVNDLKSEIFKTNPKEVLYSNKNFNILLIKNKNIFYNKISIKYFSYNKSLKILLNHFKVSNLNIFNISFNNMGIIPAGCLLKYIKFTQLVNFKHINLIKYNKKNKYIFIDFNTISNLELISSLYNNKKNSLLYFLDKTLTPMGSRLLRRWIINPIFDFIKLKDRHFIMNIIWLWNDELRFFLRKIGDLERVLGRICLKNAVFKDLLKLNIFLKSILNIIKLFNKKKNSINRHNIFLFLYKKYNILKKIIFLISSSIEEKSLDNNFIIKKGYSKKLDNLRKFDNSVYKYISNIENSEKIKYNISNLHIIYSKLDGYYIQINKKDFNLIPSHYIKIKSLKNHIRFFFTELKEFEIKVLYNRKKIIILESKIFNKIIKKIIFYIVDLQIISKYLAKLDVLSSFVYIAIHYNYKKPKFKKYSYIYFKDSRHPVLENYLDDKFISNDFFIDNKFVRTLFITGPNMGGKSTYMRQIAIICIMGCIGSYLPVTKAYIGIIDKILTRIGFSDDIMDNKSTFMVEMSEISYIINNATKNSLILIDEMGRGTSFYEGMALSWSCLNYISKYIKCITLFSTHFFEILNIGNLYKNIKKIYFNYIKVNNNIIFLYKIKEGYCNNSCSFYVAKKTGLPKIIIKTSLILFKKFKKNFNLLNKY